MPNEVLQIFVLLSALVLIAAAQIIVQFFQLVALKKMHRLFFSGPQATMPPPQHNFEIQKHLNGKWVHVGFRHEGHPDLEEAKNTPGLRVVAL